MEIERLEHADVALVPSVNVPFPKYHLGIRIRLDQLGHEVNAHIRNGLVISADQIVPVIASERS